MIHIRVPGEPGNEANVHVHENFLQALMQTVAVYGIHMLTQLVQEDRSGRQWCSQALAHPGTCPSNFCLCPSILA